ncbi:MAG: HD domain-containing protein [Lachnospiraceae bacterium]
MNGQKSKSMKRVQKILQHPLYKKYVQRIAECEKEREFCGHDMVHFLDVARIAMLLNLEENKKPIRKDWIYGAALLHDIGRFVQYADGTDHAKASAELAPEILRDCGYSREETEIITEAIANHRNKKIKDGSDLKGILYRADKASRPCYGCLMEPACDWKRKKKNMTLEI